MGRTKVQTEAWVAHRLLPTLAKLQFLSFPLSYENRDRPDLRIDSAGHEIGVELTEMIPPALAQADAIANRHYPNAVVDLSIFTWGASFTPKEIHDHLAKTTDLTGPGWVGDSVAREWAAAANDTVKTKTAKLNRVGYAHYAENWLAAYASAPGPALDLQHGATFLDPPSMAGSALTFNRIFFLTNFKVVVLDDTGFQVFQLETLTHLCDEPADSLPQERP